jgi:hypothetical protein
VSDPLDQVPDDPDARRWWSQQFDRLTAAARAGDEPEAQRILAYMQREGDPAVVAALFQRTVQRLQQREDRTPDQDPS